MSKHKNDKRDDKYEQAKKTSAANQSTQPLTKLSASPTGGYNNPGKDKKAGNDKWCKPC